MRFGVVFLTAAAASFFGTLSPSALPSITLQVTPQPVAYYSIVNAVVSTSDGSLPEVTVSINCPGGIVSSVVSQLTSAQTNTIPVRAPYYVGTCGVAAYATGYTSGTRQLTLVNYGGCSTGGIVATTINATSNFTCNFAVPIAAGSVAFVNVATMRIEPVTGTFLRSSFAASLKRAEEEGGLLNVPPVVFYQSACSQSAMTSIAINSGGANSLTNCANYNTNPVSVFQPANPFTPFYGSPMKGKYNFTVYLTDATTSSSAEGKVLSFTGYACAAANIVVVELLSNNSTPPLLISNTTLKFSAHLGLEESNPATVKAQLQCPTDTFILGEISLTSTPADFSLPTPASLANGTVCSFTAAGVSPAIAVSDPVKLTVIRQEPLRLTLQSSSANAGQSLTYVLSVASSESTVTDAVLRLSCDSGFESSVQVKTAPDAQFLSVPSDAIGPCRMFAQPLEVYYSATSFVSVIVNQPLTVITSSLSSLDGWKSGTTVSIHVSSPNLQSFTISLSTTCSITHFTANITTATPSPYPIPPGVNGLKCVLSTAGVPAFYLPIPVTVVDIGMDAAEVRQVVRSLGPGSFTGAAAPSDPMQLNEKVGGKSQLNGIVNGNGNGNGRVKRKRRT